MKSVARVAQKTLSQARGFRTSAAVANAAAEEPAMARVYGGLKDEDRIFTNVYGEDTWRVDGAVRRGDWHRTKDLLCMGPDWIVQEIKDSGLRGRGGAGFPSGLKWSFMPKQTDGRPSFLVVNADESEPGTCKDREIMRKDPHKLVEGCLIAGFAMRARAAYIYIRGEFFNEALILQEAIHEAYQRGFLGRNACGSGYDFDVYLHRGAGAYICGEETGLSRVLRAARESPASNRLSRPTRACTAAPRPLWPCLRLSCVAVDRGSLVLDARTTTVPSFSASLARQQPVHGGGRDEYSSPRSDERHCGGVRGLYPWWFFRARTGRGTVPGHYDGLRRLKQRGGSGLGTAAVTIFDKSVDMVGAIRRYSHFYTHESCGQCTPCREGTGWMEKVLTRMETGDAELEEIPMLEEISRQIEGHTICALGDAAAWPVQGLIRKFKHKIVERIEDPSSFKPEDHFQKAWPGAPLKNQEWVDKFADGSAYKSKASA
ncbi:NADH-ubiquinone oxidoreductase 51 kDa subunit, iron-sulfur binding domain [Phytophthora cactorum]|nr:NADH-ubiquinone oxidoreductase 51 kDa subunit, iron-sulfur binding domain [Phytophthora cactorum]